MLELELEPGDQLALFQHVTPCETTTCHFYPVVLKGLNKQKNKCQAIHLKTENVICWCVELGVAGDMFLHNNEYGHRSLFSQYISSSGAGIVTKPINVY